MRGKGWGWRGDMGNGGGARDDWGDDKWGGWMGGGRMVGGG